jgi:hypothetical protein
LLLGNLYMVWEYAGQAGGVISAIAAHCQTFARQHADYRSADPIQEAALATAAAPALRIPSVWQRCVVRELVFRHPLVSSVHRLHLLERFDEVLVMCAGRVVAQGPAPLLALTSAEFRQLLASYQHSSLLERALRQDERDGLRLRSLSRPT